MKNTTISIQQFQSQFPNDKVCLDYMFDHRFGKDFKCPKCGKQDKFYRIKKRKVYSCKWCGYHISPTANTIFHKSSTDLYKWFYAIYLFSVSKNGVGAKELERQLKVTYKCAWRMAKQIRSLMTDKGIKLSGIVEVDETYFGGRRMMKEKMSNKSAVIGMVERKGRIVAKKIPNRETHILLNNIQASVKRGSEIMSDELDAYKRTAQMGYIHSSIKHGKKHYVLGNIHTNSIEGFWGILKRSVSGTYSHVSSQHLQSYVNEFAFRYNRRNANYPLFYSLLDRLVG